VSIGSFFSTSCETREMHSDPQLRTRYYRNKFEKCVEALEQYAAKEHLRMEAVDKVHGEIFMVGLDYECIVTISQINPIESGIDLKVNKNGSVGWGKPKKMVLDLYRFLDSQLNFKGVSLHP
jgi:hypothetical protein